MSARQRKVSRANWLGLLLLGLLLPLPLAAGCGAETPAPAATEYHRCKLNTDCAGELVCSFGLCHAECKDTRDCPAGQRCVIAGGSVSGAAGAPDDADDSARKVCQLSSEVGCRYNTDCDLPLVCAIDLQCRNECRGERDCVAGQLCVHGVCAEASEASEECEKEGGSSEDCVLTGAEEGVTGPGSPGFGAGGGGGSEGGRGGRGGSGGVSGLGASGGTGAGGGSSAGSGGDAGAREGGESGESSLGGDAGDAGAGASNAAGTSGAGGTSGGGGVSGNGGVSSGGTSGAGNGGMNAGGAGTGGSSEVACIPRDNGGLHFGGAQYVQIPDSASLQLSDMTIEVWVNFHALVTSAIVAKPYGTGIANSFEIWYEQGAIRAGVAPTSVANALANAWTPVLGRWYHIAFTYDHATGKQSLYIDGNLAVSGTAPAEPAYDAHPVYIGADVDNGSPGLYFVGAIDEVTIAPGAKSQAEIREDLERKGPASLSAVAAHIAFDDASGQTALDASANDNRGTLGSIQSVDSADPTWATSTVPFAVTSEAAAFCSASNECPANRALQFGGGQVAHVADPVSLRLDTLTVAAWVSFSARTPTVLFVSKPYGSGDADSFALWYQSNSLMAYTGTTANALVQAAWAPVLGRWYHVAFSYNHVTGELKLYLDEDLVASGTFTPEAPPYDTHPVYVGAETNGGGLNIHFVGAIDEVRIWDRPLSLEEIVSAQHTCTLSGSTPNLVAYWPFDETPSQIAHDKTAQRNDLTLGTTVTADAADPSWTASTVMY